MPWSKLASDALASSRVFAFTAHATRWYSDVTFRPDDVLLFGPEPTGLSEEVLGHDRVTDRIRIPMLEGRRSLNLSNSAAVATYEAWRQVGTPGQPHFHGAWFQYPGYEPASFRKDADGKYHIHHTNSNEPAWGVRDSDEAGGPPVVVINQAAAARFWPGQDPVGRRILFNLEEWEIVGVAASMRMESMAEPSTPEL